MYLCACMLSEVALSMNLPVYMYPVIYNKIIFPSYAVIRLPGMYTETLYDSVHLEPGCIPLKPWTWSMNTHTHIHAQIETLKGHKPMIAKYNSLKIWHSQNTYGNDLVMVVYGVFNKTW